MEKLRVNGKRIIDENGGEIILSGINFVCKEKEAGYVNKCDESRFEWFQKQGYNVLRMGLIWDGVEPTPGQYDDCYLAKIKEQINFAKKYNMYVFLDMHQDLYSVLYADGAPVWATLTNGAQHITGDVWSDAYLESPAVQNAIDAFWGNEKVNGIGLIDYYAEMWAHVAEFFADCDNIIGYDILNEPFPGSSSQEVFGAIIAGYAQLVLKEENPDPEMLSALWFSEDEREKILSSIADMKIYKQLTQFAGDASRKFEKDILSPFFAKVHDSIDEKCAKVKNANEKFMMLETSYFSNMGIESGIEQTFSGSSIYAPHGYDLVVDTDHYEIYNNERVEYIFDCHKNAQERLDMPVLIGEWGAFTNNEKTPKLVKSLVDIFERYHWSNTYWCWYDKMDNEIYTPFLCRAYPKRTGGTILSYHYDYETKKFSMKYISDGSKTIIFHPEHGDVEFTNPIGEAEIVI